MKLRKVANSHVKDQSTKHIFAFRIAKTANHWKSFCGFSSSLNKNKQQQQKKTLSKLRMAIDNESPGRNFNKWTVSYEYLQKSITHFKK